MGATVLFLLSESQKKFWEIFGGFQEGGGCFSWHSPVEKNSGEKNEFLNVALYLY
jgi:hypothetical protein